MFNHRWIILLTLSFTLVALTGCGGTTEEANEPVIDASTTETARILWVESYHEGLAWTDAVADGLTGALENANVDLQIFHMDTRNNREEDFCMEMGEQALAEIEAFQPDVLIATDDNVQTCLVVPHLMDSDLPIVFAAVNWDASIYGYPNEHITGMLEVELVESIVSQLEEYAAGNRIAYLAVAGNTDQKTAEIYNERFFNDAMQVFLVNTYEEFQEAYLQIQEEADMLILGNHSGIEGWDDETAMAFIVENTKIPSAARTVGPDQFTLVSILKQGQEQGETAANMALQIIAGTPISEIPVVENQFGDLVINLDLAEQLGITFTPSMLRNATTIYGEE